MARALGWLILAPWILCAQSPPPKPAEPDLPEEDVTLTRPKDYALNPIQAESEYQRGVYYFKKRSYKGAAQRFEEATKWDPGMAKAWLKLGEARDKLNDSKAAREAYAKYLEAAPDAKNAAAIRKKLGGKH